MEACLDKEEAEKARREAAEKTTAEVAAREAFEKDDAEVAAILSYPNFDPRSLNQYIYHSIHIIFIT